MRQYRKYRSLSFLCYT